MLHADIRNPLNRFCCSCVRDEESLIDDGKFECYPRKVGGSFLLYGKKKSYFPFHCSVGPDWIMVVLVFTIIIVANVVVLYIVSPLGWPPVLLGAVGAILLLCAYSGAAFTDPGTVFENDYSQIGAGSIEVANLNSGDHAGDNKLGGDSMTSPINVTRPNNNNNNVRTMECGQCQFQRPLTARHCVYCQSCIDHLDHHCPW